MNNQQRMTAGINGEAVTVAFVLGTFIGIAGHFLK
jgi:galactitol-specific phosphotransferase system IIC component